MSDDSYEIAKSKYDAIGINTDEELNKLKDIPISIHSWQLDDVWNQYCKINKEPSDFEWIREVSKYEKEILLKRI
jgi:L-rhamnose isomerase